MPTAGYLEGNERLTLVEPQELYDQVVHHLGLGG